MLLKGDQGDFAASMAPRPLMLWAPLDDIGMPKEGVDQFLEKTQPAYEQAGAPRNLVIHRPPGEHAFTPDAFEAMVQFFDQFLKRDQRLSDVPVLPLNVSPRIPLSVTIISPMLRNPLTYQMPSSSLKRMGWLIYQRSGPALRT